MPQWHTEYIPGLELHMPPWCTEYIFISKAGMKLLAHLLTMKQSLFTLASAYFARHRYCYLQFLYHSTFYGILSAKHLTSLKNPLFFFPSKPLTTTTTGVKFIGFLGCSIHLAFFRRKCIEKNWAENILAIFKPENGVPWLCQCQRFSLTF